MAPPPYETSSYLEKCSSGSLVVVTVLCRDCSVSNPQPPWQARHGCTVGFDRDPPVRRHHPGRMMGTSERQLLCARLRSACVIANVENGYRWWFCGVPSDVRTPHRTMSLALSFDVGSILSIHGSVIVITFNLYERLWAFVVGSLAGSASWPRPRSRRSCRCDMPSCCQRRSTTHRSSGLFHSSHSYRASLRESCIKGAIFLRGGVLKSTLVAVNDSVHTYTVAFSPSVLIMCSLCSHSSTHGRSA